MTMFDWLRELPSHSVWVVPVLGGFVLSLGWAVLYYWHETRKAQLRVDIEREALALKRDMIERGMSAQDIERVFLASSNVARGDGD
jgi:hypothetical protein